MKKTIVIGAILLAMLWPCVAGACKNYTVEGYLQVFYDLFGTDLIIIDRFEGFKAQAFGKFFALPLGLDIQADVALVFEHRLLAKRLTFYSVALFQSNCLILEGFIEKEEYYKFPLREEGKDGKA